MGNRTLSNLRSARGSANDVDTAQAYLGAAAGGNLTADKTDNCHSTINKNWAGVEVFCKSGMNSAKCDQFIAMTCHDLNQLDSKPVGHKLLTDVGSNTYDRNSRGFKIRITPAAPGADDDLSKGSNRTISNVSGGQGSHHIRDGAPHYDERQGVGFHSVVSYNPTRFATPDGNRPAFIGLAHELCHAWNNLHGTALGESTWDEMRTVGVFDMGKNWPVSENRIRHEHGLQDRTQYAGHFKAVPKGDATVYTLLDADTLTVAPYQADVGGCGCGCGAVDACGAGGDAAEDDGHAAGADGEDLSAAFAADAHDFARASAADSIL